MIIINGFTILFLLNEHWLRKEDFKEVGALVLDLVGDMLGDMVWYMVENMVAASTRR